MSEEKAPLYYAVRIVDECQKHIAGERFWARPQLLGLVNLSIQAAIQEAVTALQSENTQLKSQVAGLVAALRVCRTLVNAAQHIPNNYPMTESQSNRFNQALADADTITAHSLEALTQGGEG